MSKPGIPAEEYREMFRATGPIEIKMIEKNENCHHEVGDVFYYDHPYKRPAGVCHALLHVLDLYTWRVALDFPSWEDDDSSVHRIHCPAKQGTVWELRKVDKGMVDG